MQRIGERGHEEIEVDRRCGEYGGVNGAQGEWMH